MASSTQAAFEVRFLEMLQRLLAEGDFSSTYKFAVLLGLTELAVETSVPGEGCRESFTTLELAEHVVALYWQQVRPFEPSRGGPEKPLRQNSGKQARIIADLADLAEKTGALPIGTLALRERDAYWKCVQKIEWKLIEMPLPRLQRFPSGNDEFLYTINWGLEDVEPFGGRIKKEVDAYQAARPHDFDNNILMKPGVVETLARLHGIVRQLVEARWILEVEKFNRHVFGERGLHDHLFGADRWDTGEVRDSLRDQQDGRCFYCGSPARQAQVDHFLPWARYPDDRIENLVVACQRCNSSKSHYLADVDYVDHWIERFDSGSAAHRQMHDIAVRVAWPEGGAATLAVASHLYGYYPEHVGLWHGVNDFRAWKRDEVTGRLARAAGEIAAPLG
jgi:Restriction endonuclease